MGDYNFQGAQLQLEPLVAPNLIKIRKLNIKSYFAVMRSLSDLF